MTSSFKKFIFNPQISLLIHPRRFELATYWVSTNYVAINAKTFPIIFSTFGFVSQKLYTYSNLCTYMLL